MYLCYDVKGIQAFVFKIPRLEYIIGGSALLDQFDRETVPDLAEQNGWKLVCSGGGKGAFRCHSEKEANEIQDELVKTAHAFGADIRIGRHDEYSEAAHCADRLFPCLPGQDELDGHPCPESGLYPVAEGEGAHRLVAKRSWSDGTVMGRWFENQLLEAKDGKPIQLIPSLQKSDQIGFMRLVDEKDGKPGFNALGGRNRWAIICMDGNDMGNQFRSMAEKKPSDTDMERWVGKVGKALDFCSREACRTAMERVARIWSGETAVKEKLEKGEFKDKDGRIVLPLRPILVGGDDIVILCHPAYAGVFVEEACRVFETESMRLAEKAAKEDPSLELWPATGGRITISAGILYCGSSLPLATAIPYAENLMAMAKAKGRSLKDENENVPSPPCVDFESVTESMLDSPATRRSREMIFLDTDIGERVELTARPYTIEEFGKLCERAEKIDVPTTILLHLLPSLRTGYHDRQVFRFRLGKHQKELAMMLDEGDKPNAAEFPNQSRWRRGKKDGNGINTRKTDLIDMVILRQELARRSDVASKEGKEN